jgi:hypothetical protein
VREFTSDLGEEEAAESALLLPAIRFTLDGEEFSCLTEMGGDALLEWSELARAAEDGMSVSGAEGSAATARFLRAAFGAEEYARLRAHIRAYGTPPSVVMAIIGGVQEEMDEVVQAATGRPTVPPSPSSPGDEDQAERQHRVISLAAGDVTLAPPPGGKAKAGKGQRRAATGG